MKQGRTQDLKLGGGGALIKIAKIFGVFRVKRFYPKKSFFFSNFRGGHTRRVRRPCEVPL
jgi:hypothetical protein